MLRAAEAANPGTRPANWTRLGHLPRCARLLLLPLGLMLSAPQQRHDEHAGLAVKLRATELLEAVHLQTPRCSLLLLLRLRSRGPIAPQVQHDEHVRLAAAGEANI